MCTLLEDTYAISNPEKKADRTNVVIMMMIDVVSIVSYNGLVSMQMVSK